MYIFCLNAQYNDHVKYICDSYRDIIHFNTIQYKYTTINEISEKCDLLLPVDTGSRYM